MRWRPSNRIEVEDRRGAGGLGGGLGGLGGGGFGLPIGGGLGGDSCDTFSIASP